MIPALIVLDVFSSFDFPGGDDLCAQARPIVQPLQSLCQRFRASGLPVVFANDHFGHWGAEFRDLLSRVSQSSPAGRQMVEALTPVPGDYRMLKPRHSAFFETPLPSLLQHLRVDRLVVCGLATDSCVLATVLDAHVRGLPSQVPPDTTASQTPERTARTLLHLRQSCGVETPVSSQVLS